MDPAASGVTAAVLRAGSVASIVALVGGIGLALTRPQLSLAVVPLQELPHQIVALQPGAWLTAGVAVLIVTPALALLATASEFAGVDKRSVALALGLVALLITSVVLAAIQN